MLIRCFSQRTLEEVNLLFAADSPFNWEAEKNYARLKAAGALEQDSNTDDMTDVEGGPTRVASRAAEKEEVMQKE